MIAPRIIAAVLVAVSPVAVALFGVRGLLAVVALLVLLGVVVWSLNIGGRVDR